LPHTQTRVDELRDQLRACAWFFGVLDATRQVEPPELWVGAGVVRDVIWGERFGPGFDPHDVSDVDVAFFDASDMTPERDAEVEQSLMAVRTDIPWDAKNQAAVHAWYPRRFGIAVPPLHSVADAVATWPETAACVAVRLSADDDLVVLCPHGLDDLLDGVWRCNPVRVTADEYARRLARKDPARRWPGVKVIG
jgi:uncharacterized protein